MFQRLWRRGLIAASLLATSTPATVAERQRFDRVMKCLPLPGGVTRETAAGRFASLDQQVQHCLRNVFPDRAGICVEDWACSSGITSAEWLSMLLKDFPEVTFTASDTLLYLIEVRQAGSSETYIVQADGVPVQYIRPPFVVSLARFQRVPWIVNRVIQGYALARWNKSLRPEFRPPADFDSGREWTPCPPFEIRKLSLIHPDVAELCSDRFRIRQHSVFESLAEPVDAIRTMNIFNRSYFEAGALRLGAAAVEVSLKPGGVWIVGRTVAEKPAKNNATIFRKASNGWQVLLRVGEGSEVEPLIEWSYSSESMGRLANVEN